MEIPSRSRPWGRLHHCVELMVSGDDVSGQYGAYWHVARSIRRIAKQASFGFIHPLFESDPPCCVDVVPCAEARPPCPRLGLIVIGVSSEQIKATPDRERKRADETASLMCEGAANEAASSTDGGGANETVALMSEGTVYEGSLPWVKEWPTRLRPLLMKGKSKTWNRSR